MRPFTMVGCLGAILLSGCIEPRKVTPPPDNEPTAVRAVVLPPLAGVRIRVGNAWLDLFEPPTIEQAMLQAGDTAELNEAQVVKVSRADGRTFAVRRSAYGTFILKDGDRLSVPRRIFP